MLAHTLSASARLGPQFLRVYKALSHVLFYLIWLFVAFLPFVLMLLSDLICIQITSPGGSPIRGKNAVRASRHATPRLATASPPLHPVQSVTSPIPILTSPASSPALAPQHHRPPHTSTLGHSLLWTHPLPVWIVTIAEPHLGDGKPYGPVSQANPTEGLLVLKACSGGESAREVGGSMTRPFLSSQEPPLSWVPQLLTPFNILAPW